MNMYRPRNAYSSQFDPNKLCATADEARAFDRAFVAEQLGAMSAPEFEAAFSRHDPKIDKALRYALEELPYAPREYGPGVDP